jgi:hypothetical protein
MSVPVIEMYFQGQVNDDQMATVAAPVPHPLSWIVEPLGRGGRWEMVASAIFFKTIEDELVVELRGGGDGLLRDEGVVV